MSTKISSDVSRLRKVLLHRPGRELLNLAPQYLAQQLYDDIPWYERAVEEHDFFAEILREKGVEIRYVRDMLCDCIADGSSREVLTERFLAEAFMDGDSVTAPLREYLSELPREELIDTMIGGLRKDGLRRSGIDKAIARGDFYDSDKRTNRPFLLDPMPNMLFTRDPFVFLGSGATVSRMYMEARRRESLFGDFLLSRHPEFQTVKRYYNRNSAYSVEGGDIMVLTPQAVAVGISERTSIDGVRLLAASLCEDFKKVLAVRIPNERRFMHLDTIMTMVGSDKFVVYREAIDDAKTLVFESGESNITEKELNLSLIDSLKEVMEIDSVKFIYCGGDDVIDSAREQWSDGANTLAIGPGEVIAYNRNPLTNCLLRENGIIVHEMPCSELSRGRGGPHCMSMPFVRD